MGDAGPPNLKVEFLLGLTYLGWLIGSFRARALAEGRFAKSGARDCASTDLMNDCQSVSHLGMNLSFFGGAYPFGSPAARL